MSSSSIPVSPKVHGGVGSQRRPLRSSLPASSKAAMSSIPRFVRKHRPAVSPVLMKTSESDQQRSGSLPLPFPFPRAESSEEGDGERCWAAVGAESCG
nr:hypothetical protein Iba_contig359CG0010 [Ipomoea batatas]